MKKLSCLNPECPLHGNVDSQSIIHYGFYRTTAGKRRRYRWVECGQTFSSTKGTPYYRLRCFRHQLLLPRPYLVLTKPLRLDIQCQRGASVKIGWKYLDD